MKPPTSLQAQAKLQTQANRYAFLLRQANAKVVEKIRTS
jgi:hypothetical protein